jgi:hypothetical protein
MVSYELSLKALTKVLGSADNFKVVAYHQVVRYRADDDDDDDNSNNADNKSNSNSTALSPVAGDSDIGQTNAGQVFYLCLGESKMALFDVQSAAKRGANASAFTTWLEYDDVYSISVNSLVEYHFMLHLNSEDVPLISLGSVYRKRILEDIQVLHNTHAIDSTSAIRSLVIKFTTGASDGTGSTGYRHPAQILMEQLVPDQVNHRKKVFYRKGYMFLMDENVHDRYELLENRPCSTYYMSLEEHQSGGDSKRDDGQRGKKKIQPSEYKRSEHMVVRIMPEKALHAQERDSELAFHLWTESIATAIAKREYEESGEARPRGELEFVDNYLVVDSGVYRKKMNVAYDQSSWSCYRVHIFTKHREIGVIGVRRKYIPPLVDTYQDFVFVLYGQYDSANIFDRERVDPFCFMRRVEAIVDSLAPATLPFMATEAAVALTERRPLPDIHSTYYDTRVLQARANALLYNKDTFAWLHNRPSLGLYPNTTFIEMECNALARIFCLSILKLFHKDDGNESGKKNAISFVDETTVTRPLSVIFRMQSDKVAAGQTADGDDDASDVTEWTNRISRYFAYCVDGGLFPNDLTIQHLTRVVTLQNGPDQDSGTESYVNDQEQKTIHRVIAFLLNLRKPGYYASIDQDGKNDNDCVAVRLMSCRTRGNALEIDPQFEFNEWVMVRLLQQSYIGKNLLDQKQGSLMTPLLVALLTKVHNLALIQATCEKIIELASGGGNRHMQPSLDSSALIGPLVYLLKHGNSCVKLHCMRALIAISFVYDSGNRRDEVSDNFDEDPDRKRMSPSHRDLINHPGCLEVALSLARDTRKQALLSNTLCFLGCLYPAAVRIYAEKTEPNPILHRPAARGSFVNTLLRIIQVWFNSNRRLHNDVLYQAIALLVKMCDDASALKEMKKRDIIRHLIDIIEDRSDLMDLQVVALACMFRVLHNHKPAISIGEQYAIKLLRALADFQRQGVGCINECRLVLGILEKATGESNLQPDRSNSQRKERWLMLKKLEAANLHTQIQKVEALADLKQATNSAFSVTMRQLKDRMDRGKREHWDLETLGKQSLALTDTVEISRPSRGRQRSGAQ